MKSLVNIDQNHLQVFHEGRKRRIFVGDLFYNSKKDIFEFFYEVIFIYACFSRQSIELFNISEYKNIKSLLLCCVYLKQKQFHYY